MVPPPLCTLPPGPGPPRFVCWCEGQEGGDEDGFTLCVTDGARLWSTCWPPDGLAALVEGALGAERGGGPRRPVQLRRSRPPALGRAPGPGGLSSSYQIWIPREAALDRGSGDGVQGSPSSTPASRVRNRPAVLTLTKPEVTAKCGCAWSLPRGVGATLGAPAAPWSILLLLRTLPHQINGALRSRGSGSWGCGRKGSGAPWGLHSARVGPLGSQQVQPAP